jgi:hypothetical protein
VNGVRSLNADAVFYRGFRYPAEIISHCVWLYYRFPLSFREVEEMMLARGVVVSHETIRQWCAKFGAAYAAGLRRRRARAGDKWHLDEVFIKVNGVRQYLWRAVDQDGNVLDILVQSRRTCCPLGRGIRWGPSQPPRWSWMLASRRVLSIVARSQAGHGGRVCDAVEVRAGDVAGGERGFAQGGALVVGLVRDGGGLVVADDRG